MHSYNVNTCTVSRNAISFFFLWHGLQLHFPCENKKYKRFILTSTFTSIPFGLSYTRTWWCSPLRDLTLNVVSTHSWRAKMEADTKEREGEGRDWNRQTKRHTKKKTEIEVDTEFVFFFVNRLPKWSEPLCFLDPLHIPFRNIDVLVSPHCYFY